MAKTWGPVSVVQKLPTCYVSKSQGWRMSLRFVLKEVEDKQNCQKFISYERERIKRLLTGKLQEKLDKRST